MKLMTGLLLRGHVVGSCRDMCPETERYHRKTIGTGSLDGYTHWLECADMVPFGSGNYFLMVSSALILIMVMRNKRMAQLW